LQSKHGDKRGTARSLQISELVDQLGKEIFEQHVAELERRLAESSD
jgi:hypothetical protein